MATADRKRLRIVASPSGGLQTLLTKIAARVPGQDMLAMYCSPAEVVLHAIVNQTWVYHAVINPSSFKLYECHGSNATMTLPSKDDDIEGVAKPYLKLVVAADELQRILKSVKAADELEFYLNSEDTLVVKRRNPRIGTKEDSTPLKDTDICPFLDQWSLASSGSVSFNAMDFRSEISPDIRACNNVTFVVTQDRMQMNREMENGATGRWEIPETIASVEMSDAPTQHTIRLNRKGLIIASGIMLDITNRFQMLLPTRDGGAVKFQGRCAGLNGHLTVMIGQHEA